jgi:glycosyltransferase involved in cell wall biosynthesis
MVDDGLKDWKLVLAGGVEVGDAGLTETLSKISEGYPVEIVKSPNFKTLVDLYGTAKIFWSASGFGEDEMKNPEGVEHFGMSVVEAMAGGAVPIVFAAGGHKEIIKEGENGFLWEKVSDLIKKTNFVIYNRASIAKRSRESSKYYSYENFESNIKKLL